MRRMVVTALLVFAALVASAAGAPTAGAVPPERFTIEFEDQFTDTEACGFPIDFRFVGSIRFTEFFDREGNLVRVQGVGSDVGTATNPTNGKTATGVDHWLQVEDVRSGEFAILGLFFHLNFPGAGIVLHDAGNITFDAEGNVIHLAGPHQTFEEDFSALCAALA
jgi:hypothetical protein